MTESAVALAPWIAAQRASLLAQRGHAWLLQGPSGLGQYALGMELVRAMLSESLVAVISQTLCKIKDGSGRVAAHEIMLGTPAIRNLIREAKVAQMYSTIQTSNNVGMQTLDQNLTELVKRNLISAAEARSKAKIPENFPG